MVRQLACPFALLAVVASVLGCNWDPPPKPVSNWSVADARLFQEFPLYWLGNDYHGLPLTYVGFSTDADDVHHALFWYGEPRYSGDAASGSWLPPLEVDIQSYCGWSPDEFLSIDWYSDPEITPVRIRGVDGYLQRWSSDDNNLYVWSANSAIGLHTWRIDLDTEEAASELTGLSPDAVERGEDFPQVTDPDC